MKSLLSLLSALALIFCVLAPQQAQAEEEMPTQVVGFFNGLADLSEKHTGDCETMGAELNKYLDNKSQVIDEAVYSTAEASKEQEDEILRAARKLGQQAGACHQAKSVENFLQRFTTLIPAQQ